MHFTRLRLNGFKSFVDPTDLVITDGLTGVVGPNGCGKSNLLEALRWVMGESRPTAMRGGGMEDVIFAGAASRPARNFAEVALTIDNTDRLAPSGFNDQDQLEVIRRITRDVGSAYKANTKDVRARDIQMLFADASTGAHSPALVRQGQIAELINAKPKNRRRILEEAAGISGLYQRRHEAELKLSGAETNLTRVDDVIEALAAQMATLARQAKQAARYREIGEELRHAEGLLLYRRWKEASDALASVAAEVREATTAASAAERDALQAEKARAEAVEALPPLREEDAIAAALTQRMAVELQSLSDAESRAEAAIESLEAQIKQLVHDLAREDELNSDAGTTIARLTTEADELKTAEAGQSDRQREAQAEAEDAAGQLTRVESGLSQQTEDVARLSARYQSAQRLVSEAQSALKRNTEAAEKAARIAAEAQQTTQSAQAAQATAEAAQTKAQAEAEAAETALVAADQARSDMAGKEADARAASAAAEGEASALRAELNALSKLVERESGTENQMLAQVSVAKGYEKALGAALADDLRAPMASGGSGWVDLPAYDTVQPLPAGVSPLSEQVKAPPALARRLSQIGIVNSQAAEAHHAELAPGQRLVTLQGDLWRWDGLVTKADDASSATALRLEQLGRVEELKLAYEAAAAQAQGAKQAHVVLSKELAALTEADKAARAARRTADQALADASRALSRAESDQSLAASRFETAQAAQSRHQAEAQAAEGQLKAAEDGLKDLPDLETARLAATQAREKVEEARREMMAKRAVEEEVRRMGEARSRRMRDIETETKRWQDRLASADARRKDLTDRQAKAEAELARAQETPATLEAQRAKLETAQQEAADRRTAATQSLTKGETALREAELLERDAQQTVSAARERRAAAQARAEAGEAAQQAARERIAEEQDCAPDALLAKLETDPEKMPDVGTIEGNIARFRRQRDALGAVNLRAEEDAIEVTEEHDALVAEKADLEEAIRTLRNGISSLNREGRERLLTAFEQVNESFGTLFTHLFGGGEARLQLVESDDPLEAGLEIMCQPPGKKLSTLSLLSGGEQTLTAMALIFAVFLANPAPICVLDEVDAPLDDANVTRFCDLLDEMTRRTDTRFLIITHHAVTMSRMDRLFGVTMQEQGVSQLVSVDLKKAEALVA